MTKAPTRLVLLACSRRKAQEPAPAIRLYRGMAYLVIHKARRAGVPPFRVVIFSAQYGLIAEDQLIAPYDQKLTAARARALAPQVQQQWQAVVRPYLADITASCLCMGETYRAAITALDGCAELPQVTITQGGIGEQLSQLKAWLYTDH